MGKRIERIPETTMTAFIAYHWTGKIPELQNLVERAVIRSTEGVLPNPLSISPANVITAVSSLGISRHDEAAMILQTLEAVNGTVGGPQGAAARLGLKRRH